MSHNLPSGLPDISTPCLQSCLLAGALCSGPTPSPPRDLGIMVSVSQAEGSGTSHGPTRFSGWGCRHPAQAPLEHDHCPVEKTVRTRVETAAVEEGMTGSGEGASCSSEGQRWPRKRSPEGFDGRAGLSRGQPAGNGAPGLRNAWVEAWRQGAARGSRNWQEASRREQRVGDSGPPGVLDSLGFIQSGVAGPWRV